jgi:NAD(P)-dependent dehydrogenase (short-subunit alcohol dehydrogenase family)
MQHKNILIIGASSGIGAALAAQVLEQGANLYTASRTQGATEGLAHYYFDAQAPDYSVFAQLPDVLHGVVYAPGTINLKPFGRFSEEEFKADFQVNVLSAIGVLQAVQPKLKRANGASVVLFSTVAVQTGMGYHASVAVSKGAIEGLTRALAAEFAPQQIRVNAIAPSLTDTPLAKQLLSTDDKKEASNRRHPIGRYGTAADVAHAAAFLLSDNSSWVTGQVLGIDGGMGSLKMV